VRQLLVIPYTSGKKVLTYWQFEKETGRERAMPHPWLEKKEKRPD